MKIYEIGLTDLYSYHLHKISNNLESHWNDVYNRMSVEIRKIYNNNVHSTNCFHKKVKIRVITDKNLIQPRAVVYRFGVDAGYHLKELQELDRYFRKFFLLMRV